MTKLNWRPWLRGLITTIITGIAHGCIAGITTSAIVPEKINTGAGLHALLSVMIFTGAASGIISLLTFLLRSPLPDDVEVQTATINPQEILDKK